MDTNGPFSTVSGTLMSIPFCIAATLLRGAPTKDIMTDCRDASANARMKAAAAPTLSTVIAVRLADSTEIVQDQRMTAADFSSDRVRTMKPVHRIDADEGVPVEAIDRMECFVMGLSGGSVKDVVGCFALPPRPLEDATGAS